MPSDLDTAVGVAVSALNNPASHPVIVFVDALNQVGDMIKLIWKINCICVLC